MDLLQRTQRLCRQVISSKSKLFSLQMAFQQWVANSKVHLFKPCHLGVYILLANHSKEQKDMFLNITFLLPLKASPIAYVMSIVLTFYTWQPGATTPVYLKYTMDHSFPVEHLNIDFVLQVVSNYLFLLARNIRFYSRLSL